MLILHYSRGFGISIRLNFMNNALKDFDVKRLLTTSQVALFLVQIDGIILWANTYAHELFGQQLKIDQIIPVPILHQLLSAFRPIVLDFKPPPIKELQQENARSANLYFENLSAIAVDIGSMDPDGGAKLIIISHSGIDAYDFKEREEFLATLAHDLRNPLGAIFGYTDVILDTSLGGSLDEKQREILIRVRATAARLIELVKNYQLLSLVNQNNPAVINDEDPPQCELNRIAKSVIESTWRESTTPSLSLKLLSDDIIVAIDGLSLERIIANLFSNALKYGDPDGVVEVSSTVEHCQGDIDFGVFIIRNSGPVLSQDECQTIFNRFVRGRNTSAIGGSGLGLYIVKQIVQKFSGQVNVISNVQIGTQFEVRIPIGRKPTIDRSCA